jgi:hypothetical protein
MTPALKKFPENGKLDLIRALGYDVNKSDNDRHSILEKIIRMKGKDDLENRLVKASKMVQSIDAKRALLYKEDALFVRSFR